MMLANQPVRGTEPEVTGPILCQTTDIVSCKRRRVRMIEDGETLPVKTGHTTFRSNPQVSLVTLQQGMNARLGKTVFGRPNLMMEVVRSLYGA